MNNTVQNFSGRTKWLHGNTYHLDVVPRASLMKAIIEAKEIAGAYSMVLQFDFEGVTVVVGPDSDPDLLFDNWLWALDSRDPKIVGPYPSPMLHRKNAVSAKQIEAEEKRQREKRQRQYDMKARVRRELVDAKLVEAPEIELSDEQSWKQFKESNQDPHGLSVVTYAEDWARLMQREMLHGKDLRDIVEITSHEADTDGVNFLMYAGAVATLMECWKYGEELGRWYDDFDTQIKGGGEEVYAMNMESKPEHFELNERE